MKRWKSTLVVVLVFAAILAYVILVERDREPPPRPGVTPSPTPIALLDTTPDALRAVQATDGERVLRLERDASGVWLIVESEDRRAAADPAAAAMTVDGLAELEARAVVLDEVSEPATYGLDPAALFLTIEMADGSEVRLTAGRETPDGTAFYVQLDGDPRLYLVDHYRIEPFTRWISTPPYAPTPTSE